MSFGITANGITIKRLQDIKSEIETALRAIWPDIDTSSTSVVGQFIGTFLKPNSDIWQAASDAYLSKSPSHAEAFALDYILQLAGLKRNDALPTTLTVGCLGTTSTVIPAGTQFKSYLGGKVVEVVNDTTILNGVGVQKQYFRLQSVTDDTAYIISVDEIAFNYNSGTGATRENIIDGIVELINDSVSTHAIASKCTSFNSDPDINAEYYDLMLVADEDHYTVDIEIVSGNIDMFMPVACQTVEVGNVPVSVGDVWTIFTPVSGLDEVYNFEAATQGRGEETDTEARIRRKLSLMQSGGGNIYAISSRVANEVDGVLAAKGYDNKSDYTKITYSELSGGYFTAGDTITNDTGSGTATVMSDDQVSVMLVDVTSGSFDGGDEFHAVGLAVEAVVSDVMAPHSISIIVNANPSDQTIRTAIAEKILECAGSGIQMNGSTSVAVVDSEGVEQTINFSYTTRVPIYVLITAAEYSEEVLPTDAEDSIKAAIKAYGDAMQVGEDVIPERFYAAVFTVPGLIPDYPTPLVQISLEDDNYAGDPITMAINEIATFDTDNITVTIS